MVNDILTIKHTIHEQQVDGQRAGVEWTRPRGSTATLHLSLSHSALPGR